MRYLFGAIEFVGGITILAGRVARLLFRARVNFSLLVEQMAILGVNSIPISIMVLSFAGAVFTLILADELASRGVGSLMGGLLLVVLLREFIPVFTAIVLSGRIGAAITSEIGTMAISEQIDALKALSTDPDWYLTLPRVLAGMLMMPLIAVFSGYGGWYAGYLVAQYKTGIHYATFSSSIDWLVDENDLFMCFVKCVAFSIVIVLTACYFGFRAKGGAAGVGKAVTNSVVANIVLIFAVDLILTAVMP